MEQQTMEMQQIRDLALAYEAIRSEYDEMEEALKAVKARKDEAENRLIMAIMDIEEKTGIDDVKFKVEGRNYSVKVKDFFTIPKADQAEAYQILKDLGHGDIVVEKVDDRTLSKEMATVIEAYRTGHPNATEDFPAEYEELLSHMNRYSKPSLSRVMAR